MNKQTVHNSFIKNFNDSEKRKRVSSLSITWNPTINKWDVKDKTGQTKWSANKYADAATFTEDYSQEKD